MSLSTRLSRLEATLPAPARAERIRELILRQYRDPECVAVMLKRDEARRAQQQDQVVALGAELRRLLGCSDAEWERLESGERLCGAWCLGEISAEGLREAERLFMQGEGEAAEALVREAAEARRRLR